MNTFDQQRSKSQASGDSTIAQAVGFLHTICHGAARERAFCFPFEISDKQADGQQLNELTALYVAPSSLKGEPHPDAEGYLVWNRSWGAGNEDFMFPHEMSFRGAGRDRI
jgi:hypothetical protein